MRRWDLQGRQRWVRLSLAVAFAAAACGGAPVPGVSQQRAERVAPAVAEVVAKFDALEVAPVDLATLKERTNEYGGLAWGSSYLLEAYLTMFEATGEEGYLQTFLVLAEALVERTDAQRGAADYLGRSTVGWGAVRCSRGGERGFWLAHTSMITHPQVRFAAMVKARGQFGHLADVAERFRAVTSTALGEFDAQWRPDPLTGGGYYAFESDAPLKIKASGEIPLPFNQQLAAGRVFVLLWKLTGEPGYRARPESLARHFKAHLQVDPRGAYEWTYWYGVGLEVTRGREDLSHGAIDVEFAVAAAGEGIVFDRGDLERFARTLIRDAHVENGKILKLDDAVGRWLGLAGVSCDVYRTVAPFLMGKSGAQHPQTLLRIARLAEHADRCAIR